MASTLVSYLAALKSFKTNSCCPNSFTSVVFPWRLCNLPGATLLENTASPQPIIASSSMAGSGIVCLTWAHTSYASYHNCCEFIGAAALLCPDVSSVVYHLRLLHPCCPLFCGDVWALQGGGERCAVFMFHLGLSILQSLVLWPLASCRSLC